MSTGIDEKDSRHCMETKRGVVFTIDALLASITAGIFLLALLYLSSQTSESTVALMQMQKQAGDALSVLDKKGELGRGNLTEMNQTLAQFFPKFARWGLDIYYYNYSSGFVEDSHLNMSARPAPSKEAQVAERRFVSFQNGTVKYGFARLKIWPEK
ncbi:MAG: hypothetical protein QW568_02100 [Candidatus Anstonellaceae archaeon]